MIRNILLAVALAGGLSLVASGATPVQAADSPRPGTVTLLDLGAKSCVPCRMMTPILEELTKEYQGRAAVVFIDVWAQEGQAEKYGARAIPTQIFFDREGKEVFRHVGFMDKAAIRARLDELLSR